MMVQSRGANAFLVTLASGAEILFSYDTPVAGFSPANHIIKATEPPKGLLKGHFRTTTKHSVTTGKHIGLYLKDNNVDTKSVITVDQQILEAFADSI